MFHLDSRSVITDGNAVFPGPKREDVVAKSRRSLDRSCLSRPPEIIWSQLGTARDHLEAAGDHLGAAGGSWSPDGGRWRPSGSQSNRLSYYLLQIVTSTFKCAHFYMLSCTWYPQISRLSHYLHIKVHFLKTLENISFYMLSCDG